MFLNQIKKILPQNPKVVLYRLKKIKITAMEKGKKVKMELTGEEL